MVEERGSSKDGLNGSLMHKRVLLIMLILSTAALAATAVLGQDKGSVDPKPLPPLHNTDPVLISYLIRLVRRGPSQTPKSPSAT
jgi:hypothetical protein